LGIGDWGLGPIPNPQSPIPNPQSPSYKYNIFSFSKIIHKLKIQFSLLKFKKMNFPNMNFQNYNFPSQNYQNSPTPNYPNNNNYNFQPNFPNQNPNINFNNNNINTNTFNNNTNMPQQQNQKNDTEFDPKYLISRKLKDISNDEFTDFISSLNINGLKELKQKIENFKFNDKIVGEFNTLGHLVEKFYGYKPERHKIMVQKYKSFTADIFKHRTIYGDGNCFYRSVLF
jgi:hypothetical protein